MTETVSLRDYLDTRCDNLQSELDRRMLTVDKLRDLSASNLSTRFTAIDTSTMLAAQAIDRRLEGMNEFRQQLNAQAATFLTRAEAEDKISAGQLARDGIEHRLQLLEQHKLNISSHDALEQRMQRLEASVANTQGRMWAIGVGFTVVTTLVSLGLHFLH